MTDTPGEKNKDIILRPQLVVHPKLELVKSLSPLPPLNIRSNTRPTFVKCSLPPLLPLSQNQRLSQSFSLHVPSLSLPATSNSKLMETEEDSDSDDEEEEGEEGEEETEGRDYYCYLLKSQTTNKTYVGYTVNLERRVRQHCGEIVGGAKATRVGRPWKIVGYVTGFPTSRSALQFEWACHQKRRYKCVQGKVKCFAEILALNKWTSTAPDLNSLSLKIIWLEPGIRLPFCPPHYSEFYASSLQGELIPYPSGPLPPIITAPPPKKKYKKYPKRH